MRTFLFVFALLLLLVSCGRESKEWPFFPETPDAGGGSMVSNTSDDYNLSQLEDQDLLKAILAKLIARNLNDHQFTSFLLSHILTESNESKEAFYLDLKDRQLFNGQRFEDRLLQSINSSNEAEGAWASVLQNASSILPNMVLDFPDWVGAILANPDINLAAEGTSIGVWPCLSKAYTSINGFDRWFGYGISQQWHTSRNLSTPFEHFPLQVKESEHTLLIAQQAPRLWNGTSLEAWFTGNNCTQWHAQLMANPGAFGGRALPAVGGYVLFPVLEAQTLAFSVCAPPLPASPPPSTCVKVCDRDCLDEYNYIDGFEFTNGSGFGIVNNQPGGEDFFLLVFRFLTAQMCGDPSASSPCPSNTWTKQVGFTATTAFHTVFGNAQNPPPGSLAVWRLGNLRLFLVPKTVRIPEDIFASNFIVRFLDQAGTNQWDGNHYGNSILVSMSEHDEVTVKQTNTISTSRSASTKVSLGLMNGTPNTGAFEFSASVTKSTTISYEYVGEKDVLLGDAGLNYCNPSYTTTLRDPLSPNTGVVALFMAFQE